MCARLFSFAAKCHSVQKCQVKTVLPDLHKIDKVQEGEVEMSSFYSKGIKVISQ